LWETTAADLHSSAPEGRPIEVRGIPHLAKNERDMGHPSIRGTMSSSTGGRMLGCQGLKPDQFGSYGTTKVVP
jgi:hypothetical protein